MRDKKLQNNNLTNKSQIINTKWKQEKKIEYKKLYQTPEHFGNNKISKTTGT